MEDTSSPSINTTSLAVSEGVLQSGNSSCCCIPDDDGDKKHINCRDAFNTEEHKKEEEDDEWEWHDSSSNHRKSTSSIHNNVASSGSGVIVVGTAAASDSGVGIEAQEGEMSSSGGEYMKDDTAEDSNEKGEDGFRDFVEAVTARSSVAAADSDVDAVRQQAHTHDTSTSTNNNNRPSINPNGLGRKKGSNSSSSGDSPDSEAVASVDGARAHSPKTLSSSFMRHVRKKMHVSFSMDAPEIVSPLSPSHALTSDDFYHVNEDADYNEGEDYEDNGDDWQGWQDEEEYSNTLLGSEGKAAVAVGEKIRLKCKRIAEAEEEEELPFWQRMRKKSIAHQQQQQQQQQDASSAVLASSSVKPSATAARSLTAATSAVDGTRSIRISLPSFVAPTSTAAATTNGPQISGGGADSNNNNNHNHNTARHDGTSSTHGTRAPGLLPPSMPALLSSVPSKPSGAALEVDSRACGAAAAVAATLEHPPLSSSVGKHGTTRDGDSREERCTAALERIANISNKELSLTVDDVKGASSQHSGGAVASLAQLRAVLNNRMATADSVQQDVAERAERNEDPEIPETHHDYSCQQQRQHRTAFAAAAEKLGVSGPASAATRDHHHHPYAFNHFSSAKQSAIADESACYAYLEKARIKRLREGKKTTVASSSTGHHSGEARRSITGSNYMSDLTHGTPPPPPPPSVVMNGDFASAAASAQQTTTAGAPYDDTRKQQPTALCCLLGTFGMSINDDTDSTAVDERLSVTEGGEQHHVASSLSNSFGACASGTFSEMMHRNNNNNSSSNGLGGDLGDSHAPFRNPAGSLPTFIRRDIQHEGVTATTTAAVATTTSTTTAAAAGARDETASTKTALQETTTAQQQQQRQQQHQEDSCDVISVKRVQRSPRAYSNYSSNFNDDSSMNACCCEAFSRNNPSALLEVMVALKFTPMQSQNWSWSTVAAVMEAHKYNQQQQQSCDAAAACGGGGNGGSPINVSFADYDLPSMTTSFRRDTCDLLMSMVSLGGGAGGGSAAATNYALPASFKGQPLSLGTSHTVAAAGAAAAAMKTPCMAKVVLPPYHFSGAATRRAASVAAAAAVTNQPQKHHHRGSSRASLSTAIMRSPANASTTGCEAGFSTSGTFDSTENKEGGVEGEDSPNVALATTWHGSEDMSSQAATVATIGGGGGSGFALTYSPVGLSRSTAPKIPLSMVTVLQMEDRQRRLKPTSPQSLADVLHSTVQMDSTPTQ